MSALTKYAPIVAAVAYLVYVGASGQTAQLPTALAGILAAFGYKSAAAAHAKIDQL